MPAIVIADSGSTKTDWCLIDSEGKKQSFRTKGMNPLLQSKEQALEILQTELLISSLTEEISRVFFYGSGVNNDEGKSQTKEVLTTFFKNAQIAIYSDLLAAARATCGKDKGVVAILGTGSNSGYYNGDIIKHQNPSLGYVIGDEGSGAFLGKRVLQYYFYRTFDEDLLAAFQQKYGDDLSLILSKVYRQPFANRYLATFVTFLKEHREHYMIENIIEDAFIDFYQRHILKYRESWRYPIHLCGSVAYEFKQIIEELHIQYGLETGLIIKTPMDGLCAFHSQERNL